MVTGRQEGLIIFNSKWKCNQKIMKVSEVSVCINLHFNPVFMVHQFNGALSIEKRVVFIIQIHFLAGFIRTGNSLL